MFCTHCGTPNPNEANFCNGCGTSFVALPTATPTPQAVVASPRRKYTAVIALAITALVTIIFLASGNGPKSTNDAKSNEDQAAISAIQQRYSPSVQLLLLHPDTESGEWFAFHGPVECTYGHPERQNCWKVTYTVNVMPDAESKKIECEWLIDMDTMTTQATNTEARTMFNLRNQ
jgi:hypothetical protein